MTDSEQSNSDRTLDIKSSKGKININNPFKYLWLWIGINVLSHLINLIQSGFLLNAIAPQCLLIQDNPSGSNILALAIVICTYYMGFGATIWYVLFVKILQEKTSIDRTILYSDEYKAEGNIELFVPSHGEV